LERGGRPAEAGGEDAVAVGGRPAALDRRDDQRRVEHAERSHHDLSRNLTHAAGTAAVVRGQVREGQRLLVGDTRTETECLELGVDLR
jgi:hypothetical protein